MSYGFTAMFFGAWSVAPSSSVTVRMTVNTFDSLCTVNTCVTVTPDAVWVPEIPTARSGS